MFDGKGNSLHSSKPISSLGDGLFLNFIQRDRRDVVSHSFPETHFSNLSSSIKIETLIKPGILDELIKFSETHLVFSRGIEDSIDDVSGWVIEGLVFLNLM